MRHLRIDLSILARLTRHALAVEPTNPRTRDCDLDLGRLVPGPLCQSGLYALGRERHFAKPDARRVEDRVADRRGDDRDRGLACAHRFRFGMVDEHALDDRHVRSDVQRLVGRPVDRRDLLVVPRDFFAEGAAQSLQRAAFELVAQAIRARDRARHPARQRSASR